MVAIRVPSMNLVRIGICMAWSSVGGLAWAQNAGGIFPPMVDEGHASLQYRITHAPSSAATVQRIHYQQAAGSSLMWRIVLQTQSTKEDGTSLQHGQGELFWDLSPEDSRWKRGLRFDARIRSGGGPGMLGLHWTNQFNLSDRWSLRLVALSSMDVGGETEPTVQLQTRGSVFTQLDSGLTLGLEFYEVYGAVGDLRSLPEQGHQMGPFAFIPVTEDIQLFTGVLAGLNDASPTLELRAWGTYTF